MVSESESRQNSIPSGLGFRVRSTHPLRPVGRLADQSWTLQGKESLNPRPYNLNLQPVLGPKSGALNPQP